MQKTVYEDYKYSMQDTGNIYVGCKYTFEELLNAEEIRRIPWRVICIIWRQTAFWSRFTGR